MIGISLKLSASRHGSAVTTPVANFSADVTSGDSPLTVQFTDTSTNTPTSWLWDFGDSNTSTSQSPSHIYTDPGTYTVVLTATNAAGSDGETKTNYITAVFTPLSLSPAFWVEADAGLITNGAARFISTDSQYLSVAGAGFPLTNKFTLSLWCKIDSVAVRSTIFSMSDSATSFMLEHDTDKVRVVFSGFAGSGVLDGGASAGVWTHFVVIYDGTLATNADRAKLYKDGVAQTLSFSGTIPATLAALPDNVTVGGTYTGYFDGLLDSIGVWSTPLTASNVTSLYNSGSGKTYNDLTTAEKVSMVSWWDLNEPSGTRYDRHGTNNLTDNNGVTSLAGIASGSATVDGDPVSIWQDQSGNARHVSVATAVRRPTLKLAIQNGLPVIRFDGSDDVLAATFSLSSPYTIYAVVQQRTGASSGRFYDLSAADVGIVYSIPPSPSIAMYAGAGLATTDLAVGAFEIMRCIWNGASSSIQISNGPLHVGNPGLPTLVSLSLAARGDLSSSAPIDYGEFILFSGLLSAGDNTAIMDYLQDKWGIDSFSPLDLAPALWLTATTGLLQTSGGSAATADGDPVGEWQDQSGHARHHVQTTSNQRPTLKLNIQNSLPVIRFDSVNDFFVSSAAFTETAVTAFIVFARGDDPPPAVGPFWMYGADGSDDTHLPYSDGRIYDNFATTVRKTTVDPVTSLTQWNIYSVVSQSGEWTSRLNGTQLFTTATNTVGFPALAANTFLGSSAGFLAYYGDMAEFIIYPTALSTAERQFVEAYLKDKWGTP